MTIVFSLSDNFWSLGVATSKGLHTWHMVSCFPKLRKYVWGMGLIEPELMCSVRQWALNVHDVNWLVSFFRSYRYSRLEIVVQQLGEKITQVAASVLESSYISIESDQFALKQFNYRVARLYFSRARCWGWPYPSTSCGSNSWWGSLGPTF